jgi:hypothetical protein
VRTRACTKNKHTSARAPIGPAHSPVYKCATPRSPIAKVVAKARTFAQEVCKPKSPVIVSAHPAKVRIADRLIVIPPPLPSPPHKRWRQLRQHGRATCFQRGRASALVRARVNEFRSLNQETRGVELSTPAGETAT